MTLEEIKASVTWCLEMEDAQDPCYHCRQKQWLIQELEKAANPLVTVTVPEPTAEQIKALFNKSIGEVTNSWKMPVLENLTLRHVFVTRDPMTTYKRQEVVFVKNWLQPGDKGCGSVPKALPIEVAQQPDRIWTLFKHTKEEEVPQLPFTPVHHHNAFSEDRTHDWNWMNGTLRYYSRVADRPVWILLEYKE